METQQTQIEGDILYLIKRRSSSEEKTNYRTNFVYDLVSLQELQSLDSQQGYILMGAIPGRLALKMRPVKHIDDLKSETKPNNVDLVLYDEMLDVVIATQGVKYKTREGKGKKNPLLPAIENAWREHFYQFGKIELDDNYFIVNKGNLWTLVSALGKIVHEEKLSDALLKLLEEEIRWGEGHKYPLLYTSKAQSLARRGFAKYVPEWGKIRWTRMKYDSFNEFLDWVTELIDKYRIKHQEENQPSLLLERAYYILERKREEINYPRKPHQQKEEIWLKDLKRLID